MRFLFPLIVLLGLLSCNASTSQTSSSTEVSKVETTVVKEETKKEEDCDEKAKKKIEIKEETISLTGNTGCSLEEAGAKPH
jgi:hypothetical protein